MPPLVNVSGLLVSLGGVEDWTEKQQLSPGGGYDSAAVTEHYGSEAPGGNPEGIIQMEFVEN